MKEAELQPVDSTLQVSTDRDRWARCSQRGTAGRLHSARIHIHTNCQLPSAPELRTKYTTRIVSSFYLL
jgi:hypothetical protein